MKTIQYTNTDGQRIPLRPVKALPLLHLAAACLGLPTKGHGALQRVITTALLYVIEHAKPIDTKCELCENCHDE